MHFLQAINSEISVLIVCNKTGGTIKGDIKENILQYAFKFSVYVICNFVNTLITADKSFYSVHLTDFAICQKLPQILVHFYVFMSQKVSWTTRWEG